MLRYLIQTSKDLIVAAVILGLMFGYTRKAFGEKGNRPLIAGVIVGLISSAVMSYMKNATNKIDTSWWNLRIYGVTTIAFLLWAVFSIRPLRMKLKKAGDLIDQILLALIAALLLFYVLPDVWAYPYNFLVTGERILSTEFLYKFIGYIFGIILILVAFAAMKNITYRLSEGWGALFLFLAMLVNAVRQICTMLQIMLTKRLIESNHTLFTIAKYSSNYKDWFIYITLLIVVFIPIILWVKSFQVNEPYSNPAEHRKIRAKWRSIRRWSSTAAICLVLVVLNMTVISAYSNREVELSPIEDAADVDDENIYVSFDQVADGHLHRYAYVTENNVEIRFIVIKKPNSSAYGIGLDACDICGETGYYEKNGQVVCKLCDVVMNINTIGFKGGCNPIVIPYEIENGTIVVPISGLLEYEKEFK